MTAALEGAAVEGATAEGAALEGAAVEGATAEGAAVQGAGLKGAGLKGAGLKGAGLKGAGLKGAGLKGAGLKGAGLRLAYGDRVVAEGLDLEIPAGKVTALVGPNACGKSTALRALARLLKPGAGAVHLDSQDIAALPSRELALKLSLLPQSPAAPDGITVRDLVARGRTPHQRWWRQWSSADEAVVDRALEATGTMDLADRSLDELSGGQRQRVWIAMALAQDTSVLLLDEPTTYLDLAHQVDVLELVTELNRTDGRTVVMVLHELNLACRYADHLIAMRDGRIVAAGPPIDMVTPALVADVFDLPATVIRCPVAGTPLVIPEGGRGHSAPSATG